MRERVLVVGAGPTGLTAAVELARRGIGVQVVDRRDGASNLSRAVGILPASLDLLAPCGATPRLLAEGVHYDGLRLHDGSRLIADLRFAAVGPGRFILGLPQDRTEAILAECLATQGGQVRYGAEVTGIAQDDAGVTVTFAGGPQERFDHVLGCDGIRSTLRGALGLPFEGLDLPDEWGVADVTVADWPFPASFAVFMLDGGAMVVVAPMAPGRLRVIANRPEPLALLPLPLAVRQTHAAGRFRISVRQVPRYSVGRVHLAGDAAHCHSPVGGRGMNLGIADAAAFAAHLAAGTLPAYSPERHAEGQATIRLSEAARRRLDGQSRAARRPVRMLAWLADRVVPLERLVMRTALGG
jgi:2-polyprenyl-6-methoxyphenol hydroxylase-like FAD-dependent oxidoreductase